MFPELEQGEAAGGDKRIDARQTVFWTGVKDSGTGGQAGLLGLLFSLCPPPMHRIAPVSSPTAKNAKYMRAAGCCTSDVNNGGRLKSTGARLYKPIITRSKKITVTTNNLINIIAFIGPFLSGHAKFVCMRPRRLPKATCLPFNPKRRPPHRTPCSRFRPGHPRFKIRGA